MGMIEYFFGFVLPYIALAIFIVGVIYRIVEWARSPIPLNIVITAGQKKSFSFLKRNIHDKIDDPMSNLGVIVRMFFEVFLMRSLFRNTRFYYDKMTNVDTRWLWFFTMAFHYSLLIILIRHLRFFTNPVPDLVKMIDWMDGMLKFWVPPIYVTGILVLVSLAFLWGRRIVLSRERCISLPSDHFALFLFAVILITGTLMRYFFKIDIPSVKTLALGLVTFTPPPYEVLKNIHWLFYVHITFVSILIAYIPFSKLMHFAGIFLSPTRNMANSTRVKRHVNPWDPNPEWPILVREGITVAGVTYKSKKVDWDTYYEMYKDQLDEVAEKGYKIGGG